MIRWQGATVIGRSTVALVLIAMVSSPYGASAAAPAATCESGKLKVTGAYSACRLKAVAIAVLKGTTPDHSKCADKFDLKFPATETKAGPGTCPSEGDAGQVKAFVDACDDAIAAQLAGGSLPLDVTTCNADLETCDTDLALCQAGCQCGNGVLDAGESCDGADLGGTTCANFGSTDYPGLACTSECKWDLSGCGLGATLPARFVDNGDQTATDLWTGRVWEMKTGAPGPFVICTDLATCPDPHDVDNDYKWSTGDPWAYVGTVKTLFLDVLNDAAGGGANCFAGHCDWRLPTAMELKGLLLEPENVGTCSAAPCIDPSFPGPTGNGGYWSETPYSDDAVFAYYARFDLGGGIHTAVKTANRYVRAVRGGL